MDPSTDQPTDEPVPEARRCLGFDDNGNSFACPNPAGTPWTPYWCPPCDEKRRARITRQLEEMTNSMTPPPHTWPKETAQKQDDKDEVPTP